MIDIVEPPVVIVVGWGAICGEIFARISGVVDVGDELRTHLIAGLQEDVHTVVVLDELRDAGGEGILFSFQLIHPMI